MPRNTGISRSPTQGGLYPSMVQDGLEALYLMEIERRNLLRQSEAFKATSAWTISGGTANGSSVANAADAPVGGQLADEIAAPGDTSFPYVGQTLGGMWSSTSLTLSVYVKEPATGGPATWAVRFNGLTTGSHQTVPYDWVDGAPSQGTALNGGANLTSPVSTVESVGNGWYRVSLSVTVGASSDQISVAIYSAFGDATVSSILVWGAQVNQGTEPLPYVPTSNKRAVYDYSGKGNHAHLGSAGVAFINPVGGDKALNLPGETGNYASSPDSAALDITGDIDIRCEVALDAYASGSRQAYVAKYDPATGNRSFMFVQNSNGSLLVNLSTSGAGGGVVEFGSTQSLSQAGFADGEGLWVRATLDVDNGSGGYEGRFYTSEDGTNWTQLGDPVVGATVLSIHSGTAPLEVGSSGVGSLYPAIGKVYRAQVYDGIDGSLVADFNAEDAHGDVTRFYSSTTGELWTIHQGAATTNDPTWTGEGLDFDVTDDQVLNIPTFAGSEFAAEGGVWTTTPGAYETLGSFTSLLNAHGGYSRTLTTAEVAQNYRAVQHALSGRGVVI